MKCYLLIIVLKSTCISLYDKQCEVLISNGGYSCYCKDAKWNFHPILSGSCSKLSFENSQLLGVGENWFLNDWMFGSVKYLKLLTTNVPDAKDNLFLKRFKQLEIADFIDSNVSILEKLSWPSTIQAINISNVSLPGFTLQDKLPNLNSLRLKETKLKKFPQLSSRLPLKVINLNGNEDILVVYEDVVPFCFLSELYVNKLIGTNKAHPTNSKEIFCECTRLKMWLHFNKIYGNVRNCSGKLGKKKMKLEDCKLDFSVNGYTEWDPCGRLLPDGYRSKSKRYFIVLFVLFLVICCLGVALVYYLVFVKRKKDLANDAASIKPHYESDRIVEEEIENIADEEVENIAEEEVENIAEEEVEK